MSVLGEQSALQYLAGQLGLEQQQPVDECKLEAVVTVSTFVPVQATLNQQRLKPEVGFWLLERREATVLEAADSDNTDFSAPVGWTSRPQTKPAYYPLVSPRSLLPRLFHHLKYQRVGRELDVDAVMKKLGRGEYLYHIPRASRRNLGRHLHIIEDHHLHLTPYWLDQGLFANLLESYLPDYANSRDVLVDGQTCDWALPPEGSLVLVFSDLGALSENPAEQVAMWLRIGAILQRMGCKLIAVVPCHPEACDPRLRVLFNLEPWEPLRQLDKWNNASRREKAGKLLHLLAPAIRLEPGLLRSVRLAVAQYGYNFDASVEAAVWQHPDMLELSSVAATPNPAARSLWLERFSLLPDPLKQTVLDIIRQWRSPLREQVWFEEISSLDASSRQVVPQADLVDANKYFRQLSQRYDRDDAEVLADVATRSWFQRMEKRLPLAAWDLPEVGTTLQQIAVQVHKYEQLYHADYPIDPAKLPSSHSTEQTLALVQQGEVLFVVATSAINQLWGKVKGSGLVSEEIIGEMAVVGGVALGGVLGGMLGNVASKTISSTVGDNVLGDILGNVASKTVSSVVGGVGGAVLGEVLGKVASKVILSDVLVTGSYLGEIRLRRGLLYVEAIDAMSETKIRQSLQFQEGQMNESLCVLTKSAAWVVRSDTETLYFKQVQRPTWADSIGQDTQGLFVEHHCLGNHYRSYWQAPDIAGASGYWQGFPPDKNDIDDYTCYANLCAIPHLPVSWQHVLSREFTQPYWQVLLEFLANEQAAGKTLLPEAGKCFNALQATPLDQVKVVILGQDPYPTRGIAHGLAFSVLPGVTPLPRSLQNIYRELREDVGVDNSHTGYLQAWAEQGVLLLNTVLSVVEGQAGSHQNCGWEVFTDAVIRVVNVQPNPVVFVLWGGHAQKKAALIDTSKHLVIQSAHPSPLSAQRGFFGSKPFSRTNAFLRQHRRSVINWQLEPLSIGNKEQ
ncbi:uracil-DNA glycosylase [Thiothrix subterranea]|uniref:Uracil-DNA glycosylase n=1 Tax=Thiothrix subterranea TaxID=2735563 RepID=A0ABU0YD70_9GAMM|nr:uracil-DNA glycosylase [Thiothrix subterranea]MDQ5770733.1 uracil-DNA glycosylase [Thiothrix subterranea]